MELDDLKEAWKRQTLQSSDQVLNDEVLSTMLHRKAGNAIDLLRRSVRLEFWSTIALLIACIILLFLLVDQTLQIIVLVIIFISCGFGYYYFKKLSLLNSLHVENKSIHENLSSFIDQFEKYLRFYRWGYNILIPISMSAGVFLGVNASKDVNFIQLVSDFRIWLIIVVLLLPLTALFNLAMKWYLKKLYGNYLVRLRAVLTELEE